MCLSLIIFSIFWIRIKSSSLTGLELRPHLFEILLFWKRLFFITVFIIIIILLILDAIGLIYSIIIFGNFFMYLLGEILILDIRKLAGVIAHVFRILER